MEISRIQSQSSFRGLHYDKNCRAFVDKYVNPKEYPQVYKDLKKLSKHADISFKPITIPVAEDFSLPAIEYTIKPNWFKRVILGRRRAYTDHIDLSCGIGDKVANILPLAIKRTMKYWKL